jgi:hypothetical protein
MKKITILGFMILFSISAKAQHVDYIYYSPIEIRLINHISGPQKLKVEPTYFNHKEVLNGSKNDTLIVYTVELEDNRYVQNIYLNFIDSISIYFPITNEYVRLVYLSNPLSFTQFLLPFKLDFTSISITEITDMKVELTFLRYETAFMKIILANPKK